MGKSAFHQQSGGGAGGGLGWAGGGRIEGAVGSLRNVFRRTRVGRQFNPLPETRYKDKDQLQRAREERGSRNRFLVWCGTRHETLAMRQG